MFIVFEGIDGSGKTTLAGRVSEILSSEGLTVLQARPKGALKSRLAADIRTLARDPRNLEMSAYTELFLFIARDTQTIDTIIRPQLNEADIVIADRYLFSASVLCRARGLVPKKDIETVLQIAARGLMPDLVIYCDVDIETSMLRKNIDKIVNPREPEDFGRKGLRGIGLRQAMRDVYLEIAAENPDTWFVVDNAHAGIEENTFKIVNHILETTRRPRLPVPTSYPQHIRLSSTDSMDADNITNSFYEFLYQLADAGRFNEAAYHLRSLDSDAAWHLRERLIENAPAITAYGLGPLNSQRSLDLRKKLSDRVPGSVACSLGAAWADTSEAAWALRKELSLLVPNEVARTLGTLDTDRAWDLREQLMQDAPIPVLASLKGLDSSRAWQLRDQWNKKKFAPGLLKGVATLDSERAWKLREHHQQHALPWFILSLLGIETDRAFDLREWYLEKATKLVLRSMAGSVHERAWTMRQKSAVWAHEALTTIKNLDTQGAWALRREFMDTAPGAVGKSVGVTLAMTPDGFSFLMELVMRHKQDPDVLHYFVKAVEAKQKEKEDLSCTIL